MSFVVTADELRAIPLFEGVSEAGLERLVACATRVEAQPGQVLALPGDAGTGMYVVLEGTAMVELRRGFQTPLGEGNFFGEIALLVPGSTRVARVRAGTKLTCISIPRQDFLALVESEPTLALRMLRELARRLSEASLDS